MGIQGGVYRIGLSDRS